MGDSRILTATPAPLNGAQERGDGKWEMGNGRWEMGDGKWEMGSGRWEAAFSLLLCGGSAHLDHDQSAILNYATYWIANNQ